MRPGRLVFVHEAFRRLDRTGDGVITVEDLEQVGGCAGQCRAAQGSAVQCNTVLIAHLGMVLISVG